YNIHEGYAGIDIDPVTGDPMVAFHCDFDSTTTDLEVLFSYDMLHLGNPGLWYSPFTIIDDNTPSPWWQADEFIWPQIEIGPSPNPDKRRVYVAARNAESPMSEPSQNVLVAYADFDVNDLNLQSTLDWTYFTIPLMDDWAWGVPEWKRPYYSLAVSDDGKVAFIGYVVTDGQTSILPDRFFVLLNDNFGEGDFMFYDQSCEFDVWNPQNLDGSYAFQDDNGDPLQLYFAPYLGRNFNAIFNSDSSKLTFISNMGLKSRPDDYISGEKLIYPKIISFNLMTEEFSFYDLYQQGADPYDDNPMIPWDLDEDGEVDEYDVDGNVLWTEGWPIFFPNEDLMRHENNFKLTSNDEIGWQVAVWNDGLKARLAEEGVPGYEDWLETPEIAICYSNSNGYNWSQPIFLNAIETPELADMTPCYVYPGDKIEYLGNNHYKLHLFFLDDYSYGSSIQGFGDNLGGMQMYCSIDIDTFADSQENTIPQTQISLNNYPNPFNPTTTISFNVTQTSAFATIEIYNLKGQKIKTFSHAELVEACGTPNSYFVVWNGRDDYNKLVSSGIYFAKLKAGKTELTRKMLLMK
ncbi:MAG: hypothetical protein K9N39_12010, partial [Candidatus Cloacimonetes bacterium]|nr:hypothetical protein [Candidatus Cloacimonadota bacterium]